MNRYRALSAAITLALAGVAGAAETKVSPAAQAVVAQVASAYSGLHSLQVTGTFSAELDIAGKTRSEKNEFTGSFGAPNKFRHELKDDTAAGSTGEKVFVYSARDNVYFSSGTSAATSKPAASDIPENIRAVMLDQNPSILLAVSKDPAATLKADVEDISLAAPITVDGTAYDTLVLSMGSDKPTIRVMVDPKTHLIRQWQADVKADTIRRGAQDVKKALVTIDYTTTLPDAAVADAAFAWVPPTGAQDKNPAKADNDAIGAEAKALIGKPAPDFTLKQLDGADVILKELKGNVVVLDFWATWCGPCVEALPHLDAISKEYKDKGVKVLAVNMQEDATDLQKFVDERKLTLPIVLEPKGNVAESFKVEPLPTTIVIGKDGTIRNVFVVGGEAALRKAIDEAAAAK